MHLKTVFKVTVKATLQVFVQRSRRFNSDAKKANYKCNNLFLSGFCTLFLKLTVILTIMTGPVLGIIPPKLSDCIFEDLSKEEANKGNLEVTLDNYFDGVPGFQVGTVEEMTARIKEKHHKCGVYNVLCNNCEHVATYIRYNQSISLQVWSWFSWPIIFAVLLLFIFIQSFQPKLEMLHELWTPQKTFLFFIISSKQITWF